MTKKLVIVESPAKTKTLSKILGSSYSIKATVGHIRDLPKGNLGIDTDNDFTPRYVIPVQRRKVIKEIKDSINDASAVYLATDPDREGEAISWHLVEAIDRNNNKLPFYRVSFNEITKEAVKHAFEHPRDIDMNLVNAQQARRILDRLVGYKLSPLLWKKIQRGLSAGRVQSAAVRIIVDREREIQNFVPVEYWTIEAELSKKSSQKKNEVFRAQFAGKPDGSKIEISNETHATKLEAELQVADYNVSGIQIKEAPRQPSPPFITSTLQQEAWRRLKFTAKRTMVIAQQLYEGISLGAEGSVGLITYMRTDSIHVAPSAISETRDYIKNKFGDDFLPPQARAFAQKGKFAQEGHEAIRPTKIYREPEQIRSYLDVQQFKLYELIWKRMVASQMAAARYENITVEIIAANRSVHTEYLFKATSSVAIFNGFMSLYIEEADEDNTADNDKGNGAKEKQKGLVLHRLKTNDALSLIQLVTEQLFTQPPPRYTEATLIKALEQKGIGRPSTYAPILSTIQDRDYINKKAGRFYPDEMGIIVNDLLVEHFPKIVDLSFTAKLEKDLDNIAQGKKEWRTVLKGFYFPFEEKISSAFSTIEKIKIPAKESGEVCPICGKPMVIKTGRFGKFLACSGYPDCKQTMPLVVKTGIPCPYCKEKGENGELIERVNKKKRRFYGCSRYPECKFISNSKPLPKPCPECGGVMVSYRKSMAKCLTCDHKEKLQENDKMEVS
jgi:DNA topoisomerase-1